MGKTATSELAYLGPPATTNPHDKDRTPGGSSSGSAATVASFMAPASIGSQTGGSVIRPASYCGVVGYKPSYGLISRNGVLRTSYSLDQIGMFGRKVEDVAMLAKVLIKKDKYDPATTNPHDKDRTPGGSSSGSAASVASFMAPASIGSQTGGSVIRPASYCGVVGYKPSYGLISRNGVLRLSLIHI